jgi:SagB-type dehydrogenase family enzyme
MKRLRHDLNYLTSAGLLVSAVVTGLTGIIADLWDLNDFWYHTIAGYVMGALAIVHVVLNWQRLVSYIRFRLTRRPPDPTATVAAQRLPAPQPGPSARGAALSRRGVLGLAVGGIGGWILGQGLRQPPTIPHGSDVGVVYHQWSKPGVIDVLGTVGNWGQQPALTKEYPGARLVRLPPPELQRGLVTAEAMHRRRSTRDYSGAPMTLGQLSTVLYLTSGVSAGHGSRPRRTAPSSGALYPIEMYPVVHDVTGLAPGVYHYAYNEHALSELAPGDFRSRVVEQSLQQEFLGQCNVVVFLTNIIQRMRFKYQDRSYRYGLLEAGHLGQNLYLAATSLGLGACGVGAFMDDDINSMLGVDGVEEAAVYMLALGSIQA